jgi:hypothetical protein
MEWIMSFRTSSALCAAASMAAGSIPTSDPLKRLRWRATSLSIIGALSGASAASVVWRFAMFVPFDRSFALALYRQYSTIVKLLQYILLLK